MKYELTLLCQLAAIIYDKTRLFLKAICVKLHIQYFDIYLHSRLSSNFPMFRSPLFSFSLLIFVLMLSGEGEFTRGIYSLVTDFSCFRLSSIFLQNISWILFLVTKHITYRYTFPTRKETSYSDRRFRCSYILFIIIIGGILVLFIYITRLGSKEIFSPSNRIHREVGRARDLSAPQ